MADNGVMMQYIEFANLCKKEQKLKEHWQTLKQQIYEERNDGLRSQLQKELEDVECELEDTKWLHHTLSCRL